MRVECEECGRKLGVGLTAATPDYEELAALKLLARNCARLRINGECEAHTRAKSLKANEEAEVAL